MIEISNNTARELKEMSILGTNESEFNSVFKDDYNANTFT